MNTLRTLFVISAALVAFLAPAAAAQLTISWTDNADNENGVAIERKPAADQQADFVQVATVPADVVAFVDLGLPAETAFTYRVRAYNARGFSPYSNEATGTTLPDLPAGPGSLQAPDEKPILDADGNLIVRGTLRVHGDLEVAGVIRNQLSVSP